HLRSPPAQLPGAAGAVDEPGQDVLSVEAHVHAPRCGGDRRRWATPDVTAPRYDETREVSCVRRPMVGSLPRWRPGRGGQFAPDVVPTSPQHPRSEPCPCDP